MMRYLRSIKNKVQKFSRFLYFRKNDIKIARGSYVSAGVKIGRCTRVNNPSYIADCEIGAFCAFGGRLVVRSSNHSVNTINIQDWAQRKIIKSSVEVAGHTKGAIKIGHGVWVGDSVIILPGAEIGNGAVIGAGSVITKAIPPYAIAVGNPARVIKYRFSEEVIDVIKSIQWWNWSYKKMNKNKAFFEIDLQSIEADKLKVILKDMGVI